METGEFPGHQPRRVEHDRKESANLKIPTPREEADHPPVSINTEPIQELPGKGTRSYDIEQRMAHECHIDASLPIEGRFKRQNHNQLVYQSSDFVDTPPSPGPNLGADIVENRDSPFLEVRRHAEVEIREIDQNSQIERFLDQGSFHLSKGFGDGSQFGQDFDDANNGELRIVEEKLCPRPFETLTSDPVEMNCRGELMDGLDKVIPVEISRCLSSDNQNTLGPDSLDHLFRPGEYLDSLIVPFFL
jgi:hypothetical protein